jgi:predicted SnoaL-like aldol condensation-catalyzing enzyme
VNKSESDKAKAFVLMAFDTLFNQRDYKTAESMWSPSYIQHSAHIAQGRAGLFDLIKSLPPSLRYENHVVIAENNMVMLHGRFSGTGLPANWIAGDIVRLEGGQLMEHWDVIQDEATLASSKSGLPMFGKVFPS